MRGGGFSIHFVCITRIYMYMQIILLNYVQPCVVIFLLYCIYIFNIILRYLLIPFFSKIYFTNMGSQKLRLKQCFPKLLRQMRG